MAILKTCHHMSPHVIACQYPIRAGCSRVRAYPAGKEVGLKTECRNGVRVRRVRVGNDRIIRLERTPRTPLVAT